MDLTIKVIEKIPKILDEVLYCRGEIKIGGEGETFLMPIEYFSLEDYEKQWKDGLERLKYHKTSCLISEIGDPRFGMHAFVYELCKNQVLNKLFVRPSLFINNIVEDLIEDRILPKDLRNKEFNEKTCYEFIAPFILDPESPYDQWIIDLE